MKKILLMLTILVQVSVVFSQTHFKKGYASDAPSDPMAIKVKSAIIEGVAAQPGDEIAVFDGNLCCGVLVLTGVLDPDNSATWEILKASADDGVDGLGNPLLNGFTSGNVIYYRFWDSSLNKEYHNVVATYHNTSNVEISPQPFANNGGAFVLLSAVSTTKTWNGSYLFPLWSVASNWTPAGVPGPNSDVVIPSVISKQPLILSTEGFYCGNLEFQSNPLLTIYSDGSGTGSLIVAGDIITDAETVNVQRYMSGNAWHMVSSPVPGQTIGSFLAANTTILTKDVTSRGMIEYSESVDDWSIPFTNSTGGSVSSGKGFGVRTDGVSAVSFSGSLSNGDVTISVTRTADPGNGWNLIGNPYTSAIYTRQEVFGFLTVNAGAIDDSYEAIYLWDQGAGSYTVINSDEGDSWLASGQGFFVKAASSGTVTFSQAMQVHKTDVTFKSGTIPSANVILKANSGDIYSSTKINFKEEMTLGLDPGHDAGILRSGNGFDIYSRLVTDNGIDFAVQALPGKASDSYVIPIGIDAVKGGEIVLSAQSLNLPVGYDVIIEDRLTNTQTNIKNGELYVAEIASNSKGVGRFYLHVGSSLQTVLDEIKQNDITVYTIDQNVYIKGAVSKNAQFMVYSVDGRLMNRFGASSQNLNQFSIAGYSPGIYLINVGDNNKYKSLKFVVGK